MRSFTLYEGDRATMMHVSNDGNVTIFERDRDAIRFRIPMDVDRETTWQLLSRVVAGIVRAEERLIRIDRLVERLQTGWRPVASEIDPDIPQRTLQQAHFAYDAIAYPDGMGFYSQPTKLLGRDERGYVEPTGTILWIDAERQWAVCDDGFWWTP
jgi:hypothetical protein